MNTQRLGGIAGIIFVVVMVGAGFVVPPPPAPDDPPAKFLEYLSDNRTGSMIQASLTALAAIPLLPFAIAFGQRIRRLEGKQPILGAASTAGLLAGWAAGVPFIMLYGGLAWLADGSLAEDDARNFMMLVNVGYGGVIAIWAGVAVCSGVALINAQGFARWLGSLGMLAALLCVIAVFGWASSGIMAPGQAFFLAYLAVSVYLLANAMAMVRGK